MVKPNPQAALTSEIDSVSVDRASQHSVRVPAVSKARKRRQLPLLDLEGSGKGFWRSIERKSRRAPREDSLREEWNR